MTNRPFKALLMQIREQPRIREEEWLSFVRLGKIHPEQLDILNLFDTPEFDRSILDNYDALFVGGASEANVLHPELYPFVPNAQQLLLDCLEQELPVFASCFGYQLAVLALNGSIHHQDEGFEMGSVPIQTTSAAKTDPLLSQIPSPFMAISVHQQYATQSPINTTSLAYSDQCHHAFRVTNKPFWAFQFHPEVDRATLIERLTHYKDRYTKNDAHLQTVLSQTKEVPESNQLVARFIRYVIARIGT